MPFRRGLALRPVRSLKHVVDIPSSVVTAIQTVVPVAEGVANPSLSNTEQVAQGCTISSFYLRVEVLATGNYSGVPRVYMAVMKNPGNNLSLPDANAVGSSDSKRYIIHQEMIMVQDNVGTSLFPRTLFQGVIKIPPRLKRFGYNDRLIILLQNGVGETSGISNVCVQTIYKEFR